MTNAEMIRKMDDKELAGFLAFHDCPVEPCTMYNHCDKCWLAWLEDEADEWI